MSESTEVVEGQELARAVLRALDQGARPDWDALDRAYRPALLAQAARRLHQFNLVHQFTPDDVLNDFLVQRVYPPGRARKMFGPSAEGERPLRGQLLSSIANHCSDMGRRADRSQPASDPAMIETAPAGTNETPDLEEVRGLVRQQMAAVRAACAPRRRPAGGAFREALLLRLRLDWALIYHDDLALLEQLMPWTDDEQTMPLVEQGQTLEQMWQQLRALPAGLNRGVPPAQLAALVPMKQGNWNTLISRGRMRLRALLGGRYHEVFALWAREGRA